MNKNVKFNFLRCTKLNYSLKVKKIFFKNPINLFIVNLSILLINEYHFLPIKRSGKKFIINPNSYKLVVPHLLSTYLIK